MFHSHLLFPLFVRLNVIFYDIFVLLFSLEMLIQFLGKLYLIYNVSLD